MNKPDDFDAWRLPDDESVQKVSLQKDTRAPNSAVFVIEREDHTLGNMLRMRMLDDDDVLFSGYRVPHPLEPAIQVKVQTRSENPGPVKAVEDALGHLLKEMDTIESAFRKELTAHASRTGRAPTGASAGDGFDPMSIG